MKKAFGVSIIVISGIDGTFRLKSKTSQRIKTPCNFISPFWTISISHTCSNKILAENVDNAALQSYLYKHTCPLVANQLYISR